MLKNTRADKNYVSILADGTFRVVVPEGTEGAVKRDYETSDKLTGTKYELVFTEMSGIISKIAFFKGKYGNLLQLTISDGDEKPLTLSVQTSSNFGADLMKKLPNIDLDEYVCLVPYSFKDKVTAKERKGVTVYQGEEENEEGEMVRAKIDNFFYDADKKKNLHKFPETPVAKKGKDINWKMYFMQVDEFLVDYITENFEVSEAVVADDEDDEEDDSDPEFKDTRTDAERKKGASKKEAGVKGKGYEGKLKDGKEF